MVQPLGGGRAHLDPGQDAIGGVTHDHRGFVRRGNAALAELDPVFVRQRIGDEPRHEEPPALRWVLREPQIELLVDVAFDVGERELYVEERGGGDHFLEASLAQSGFRARRLCPPLAARSEQLGVSVLEVLSPRRELFRDAVELAELLLDP
jgi:hypothetical protein